MVGLNDSPRDGECHLLFQGPAMIRSVENLVLYTRETAHPFLVAETVALAATPTVVLRNCSRYTRRVECVFLNMSSVPEPQDQSGSDGHPDGTNVVVEELSLRGNPLTHLAASSFHADGWKMLQVLDLSHCLLTTIAPAAFALLGELRLLKLSENIDLVPASWAVGVGAGAGEQITAPLPRSHRSPFCSSTTATATVPIATGAAESGEAEVDAAELHCAAAATLVHLDLSQTNLADVPSYFFDRIGLPALSSFTALGLENFTAVGMDAFALQSGKVCDVSVGISQAASSAVAGGADDGGETAEVSVSRKVSWCETLYPNSALAWIQCTCAATDAAGDAEVGYGPGTWTTTAEGGEEEDETAAVGEEYHHGCWQKTRVPDPPLFLGQAPAPAPHAVAAPAAATAAPAPAPAMVPDTRRGRRSSTGSACISRLSYTATFPADARITAAYAKAVIKAPNGVDSTLATAVLCIAPQTKRSQWAENDDKVLGPQMEQDSKIWSTALVGATSAAGNATTVADGYPECAPGKEYRFEFDVALQSTVQVSVVANNEARDPKESELSPGVIADAAEPCDAAFLGATGAAVSGLAAGPAVGVALAAVLAVLLVGAVVQHERRRRHQNYLLNKPVDPDTFLELAKNMQESGMFVMDTPGSTMVLSSMPRNGGEAAAAGGGGGGGGNTPDDEGIRYPRELPRQCVDLLEQIGEGNFGTVWKGLLDERRGNNQQSATAAPSFPVAVKMTKGAADGGGIATNDEEMVAEFVREAVITAQFVHPNVVGLVGVVSAGRPLLMVMELCEHGGLSTFLKKRKAERWHVSLGQRLSICEQTAVGLGYMASKRFVHRDIASRNVLVSADFKFKISDFGLGREVSDDAEGAYYRSNRGLALPVRWCAPEVLNDGFYSTASDVWAWGVLAQEIFSDAALPYEGMKNAEVWSKVSGGQFQPQAPITCPPEIWDAVVAPCFTPEASLRPSFMRLAQLVAEHNSESTLAAGHAAGNGDVGAGALAGGSDAAGELNASYWKSGDPLHADAQYMTPSSVSLREGDNSVGSAASQQYEYADDGMVVNNAAFDHQLVESSDDVGNTAAYVNDAAVAASMAHEVQGSTSDLGAGHYVNGSVQQQQQQQGEGPTSTIIVKGRGKSGRSYQVPILDASNPANTSEFC